MIVTLRTTVGRENSVIETLSNRIRNLQADVRAILHPSELKGYIFIEGELSEIERAVQGVPHIRGLLKREVSINDIKKFLEFKKIEIKINRGDVIEITSGPFRNEKGKVTRIDETKEEITVELLEATIPIPITVKLDSVKLIESAEKRG